MDVESWRRICRTVKAFGLNHLRFHSWIPPEAAFAAADEEGVLFQVEAPQANVDQGQVSDRDAFIAQANCGGSCAPTATTRRSVF